MTGKDDLVARRKALFGDSVTTFYRDPVAPVSGEGAWLREADGTRLLDAYNNVPHVGHAHPRVVEAICKQAATLNTHTRYLHEGVVSYGERLTGLLAPGLDQLVFTCTGSEANDIALRMGQAVTGKCGFIATDATYHGNTALVSHTAKGRSRIGLKCNYVRHVPAPDSLRPLGGNAGKQARAFARNVTRAIDELREEGYGLAALILDPFFANEGFPSLPRGFLDETVKAVRHAGGIIIADEVQPGFGRLGSHFWGHERIGLSPDVVTMGKPMGNGHPIAAVVTRPEIMSAFRAGFAYFNTFGGNPVSAAAGNAVLDVIADEALMENARETGAYLLDRLRALIHPFIGEVRGAGLFLGIEFVSDGKLSPAGEFTGELVERMREAGVLVGRTGKGGNVLKIRPPMCFSRAEADLLVDTLAGVLAGMPA